MLDLHGCVDGGPFVGIELLAGFGSGGDKDSVIIYVFESAGVSYELSRVKFWAVGLGSGSEWVERTFEGYTGGAEDLAIGGDCVEGWCCHFEN